VGVYVTAPQTEQDVPYRCLEPNDVNSLLTDIRYSIRGLRRGALPICIGVLVLAVSVGFTLATVTIIRAIFFNDSPILPQDQLAYIYASDGPNSLMGISYRDYTHLLTSHIFADVVVHDEDSARFGADPSSQIKGEKVSANYFSFLGVHPIIGRTFVPGDEATDAPATVILSETIWKKYFRADPSIIGTKTVLFARDVFGYYRNTGHEYTVIGVIGEPFKGTSNPWERTQYWVPLMQRAQDYDMDFPKFLDSRWTGFAIARLKPESNIQLTRAVIRDAGMYLQRIHHSNRPQWVLNLDLTPRINLPFDPSGRLPGRRIAAAVISVCGIVVAMAALNLAGVLMARAMARSSDIAIHAALGANRWRLVRYFVTEGILIALASCTLAVFIGNLVLGVLHNDAPTQFGGITAELHEVTLNARFDIRLYILSIFISVGAGALIGMLAGYQALRIDCFSALSHATGGSAGGIWTKLRRWVLVPQISVSLVLILLGAIIVDSYRAAAFDRLGYTSHDVVFVNFGLPPPRLTEQTQQRIDTYISTRSNMVQRLLDNVRVLPGFNTLSITSHLPMEPLPRASIIARDDARRGYLYYWVSRVDISPRYFATLGMPLIAGRDFDQSDGFSGHHVAIVSEGLAQLLWSHNNPLGRYIAMQESQSETAPDWVEVVGLVNDIHPVITDSLSQPVLYLPIRDGTLVRHVLATGTSRPGDMIVHLISTINATNPAIEVAFSGTVEGAVRDATYPRRLASGMLMLGAGLGVALAAIGLYGVVSSATAQRRREMAVRLALGAKGRTVVVLLINDVLRLGAVGLALGLGLAIVVIRVISSMITPVSFPSYLMVASAIVVLTLSLLLPCYAPARRALLIDPIATLKEP
jgi:predicted permease